MKESFKFFVNHGGTVARQMLIGKFQVFFRKYGEWGRTGMGVTAFLAPADTSQGPSS